MRILAFSDLHDEEAAFESVRRLSPSYDFVFACGDISRSASFAEEVASLPNILVVPGNWDNQRACGALLKSPSCVHMRRRELADGLNAVGFGYSAPTPFGTYGELSERKILSDMSSLPIDGNTLLLLHSPPRGHFDLAPGGRHIGSESVLRIIEERRPLAAFFGHAHEHEGVSMLGPTTLVKLPPVNYMRACSVHIMNKRITAEFIAL